jgi:molybdopterin synthase sulfur carrier subunit
MVTVRIPAQMRTLTGGASTVEVDGSTVTDVLAALGGRYEGIAARLFDEQGGLRRFVNVYVDEEDIRFAQGLETPVSDGQTVSLLPAVAGG